MIHSQIEVEYGEIGIQTDENSIDQYDQLEAYFNPSYFDNQEFLLKELYLDNETRESKNNNQKQYSQSLGNLDEFQQTQAQGKPQTFNFQMLEKYSDAKQQAKKQQLNIGQLYMQQLEKQASSLKKIELKFSVKNDESQNGLRKGQSMGKIPIKSSHLELDTSIQPQSQTNQEAKKGSCQTYFLDYKTNSTIRFYGKNDDNMNLKYNSQQLYQTNTYNEHAYIKQKYKQISQHSSNNLGQQEEYQTKSPSKRQLAISNNIRAMSSNQQFRQSFHYIKQEDTNNQNSNYQLNMLKSMFSDFQQEIKQREANIATDINNQQEQKIDQPSSFQNLTNILNTQNQLKQNQQSITVSRLPIQQYQQKQQDIFKKRQIKSSKKQGFSRLIQQQLTQPNFSDNNISNQLNQKQSQFNQYQKNLNLDSQSQNQININHKKSSSVACLN